MKPLPPVRRTVGFGYEAVMITEAFTRRGEFDLTDISRNGLDKDDVYDVGMPVPLTWG